MFLPCGFFSLKNWLLRLSATRAFSRSEKVTTPRRIKYQIDDARLKPFGSVIFQVFFDGPNMSLEVMHVSLKGFVIVFSRHQLPPKWSMGGPGSVRIENVLVLSELCLGRFCFCFRRFIGINRQR